jgi:hypothetical protein
LKEVLNQLMSGVDIGYFLKVADHVVNSYFSKKGRRSNIKKTLADGMFLSFRLASEIYQAVDIAPEWTTKDLAYLLDTTERYVKHALENRAVLGPRIVANLKIIFPSDNIKMPYLSGQ